MGMMVPPKKVTDDDVARLRSEKLELNRHSRRQMGMKTACRGKVDGVLECQTSEGTCPDFGQCHPGEKEA